MQLSVLAHRHERALKKDMRRSSPRFLILVSLAAIGALAPVETAKCRHPAAGVALGSEDRAFLDDLSHRAFLYFVEQADPDTGLVRDRALTTGVVESQADRDAASIAATGF